MKGRLLSIAKDTLLTLCIISAAVLVCAPLSQVFDDNNPFAASVFMLAVVLIALTTNGYVYGIAGAAVSVFCINYMFTYPFMQFSLSIAGYPMTFAVMLIVSVIISTLTTRVKRQEHVKYIADREKMRANLLRSVSHDLRTPLSSILGASSALLENEDLSKDERDGLISEMNRDARWLVRVMENILSITKLSGDDVRLAKESEVVEEIVGSAIVKFRRLPDSVPVTVKRPEEILLAPMDATLIEQVLINLFENAVVHGQGVTRIDVRVTRENSRVVILTEDDGKGIAPAVLPRIFDGSVHSAAEDNSDGRRNMGIGLSVCQSIINAHGGGISAANRASGGASICFWLPLDDEQG